MKLLRNWRRAAPSGSSAAAPAARMKTIPEADLLHKRSTLQSSGIDGRALQGVKTGRPVVHWSGGLFCRYAEANTCPTHLHMHLYIML